MNQQAERLADTVIRCIDGGDVPDINDVHDLARAVKDSNNEQDYSHPSYYQPGDNR